jgi:hypothetical protein
MQSSVNRTQFGAETQDDGCVLNHPPLFLAGELALGLSLSMFVGALITALGDRIRIAGGRRY